jgi:hypothetical protein
MRYLICAVLAAAACGRENAARDAQRADTTPPAPPAAAPAPAPDTAALTARLVGTWKAQGYDSGSTRPQRFTITWTRDPAGGLAGEIAFRPGEKYGVKIVSMSDSTVVYESEPHRSPTLKADVVTHTEARLSGDSLTGTYEARATAGEQVLRGRFGAARAR